MVGAGDDAMAKNSQVFIWLIAPALDDHEENSSAGCNN
jgi:hypothetical protein